MSLPSLPPPLEVTVTPCQSSFFAGEDLRCLITFANLNTPVPVSQPLPSTSRFPDPFAVKDRRIVSQAIPSSQSATFGGGHGKSQSVTWDSPQGTGMARGRSKTEGNSETDLNGDQLPTRRRLIGSKASGSAGSGSERRHGKAKSLATLSNHGRGSSSPSRGVGMGLPSAMQRSYSYDRDASAASLDNPVSPTSNRSNRRTSNTIGVNHPHSRKKSVIEMQSEALTHAFDLSNGGRPLSPSSSSNQLYARSANTSSASLAPSPTQGTPTISFNDERSVEDDADGNSPSGFYGLGRNDTMDSIVRDRLTDWSKGPAGIPRSTSRTSPMFPQMEGRPQGSEKVLWSFAQFSGSYEIDESLIKPAEFEQVKRRLAFGDGVSSNVNSPTMGFGGGDLGLGDITGLASQPGWSGFLRGATSANNLGQGGRHRRTGSTMLDTRQKTMESKSIPLFSSPPSILAVDLELLPGEKKTYSFTLRLPADLPPSYFGKAIRFKYQLVIGTNRVESHRSSSGRSNGQKSRLIQIPLRVYNHVHIAGAKSFFDLTNPVVLLRDEAVVREADDPEERQRFFKAPPLQNRLLPQEAAAAAIPQRKKSATERNLRALRKYARILLSSCESADVSLDSIGSAIGSADRSMGRLSLSRGPSSDGGSSTGLPDDEEALGELFSGSRKVSSGIPGLSMVEEDDTATCKGAVEILSRNSSKISYDIAKDGQVAAILTLLKGKYRLGDTILGAVRINRDSATARVVRVAAVLESYEEVQPSLATLPAARMQKTTRQVHAEHHENTLDAGQASFSLPMPSGATPDFSTSAVKLHWVVRLSFLTLVTVSPPPPQGTTPIAARRPPPPPHLQPCSEDGYSLYHTSHRAVPSLAGISVARSRSDAPSQQSATATATSTSTLTTSEAKLEIVECAVPINVLPNSTSFKASSVSFAA